MSSRPPYDVAIVGAGVAGSVVAIALARNAPRSYRAVLLDDCEAGPGTAYRPQSETLLMNGPVRAMSVMPDDPHHLERHARDTHADALISRAEFGRYVRSTLHDATARHRGIEIERARVVDIERHPVGYLLRDRDGTTIAARSVVLALGNFAPADGFLPLEVRSHPSYAGDPWRFDESTLGARSVALIGSGLTAMDVVAQLDERGYDGTVHVISRHGLIPHVERPEVRGLPHADLALDWSSPSALVHTMRAAAARHTSRGGDWRAVAESIRKISQEIWHAWTIEQRKQFLRHVQPHWSAHRYRVPPATFEAYERFAGRGQIVRHCGRIASALGNADGTLDLSLRHAGASYDVTVEAIVNCTGPQGNYAALTQPLVRNARNRGLLRHDALKLGIDASATYNVLDADGIPQKHLFTLGPPLRGMLYETTAVPEIRDQAARIAGALIALHEPETAGIAS